MSWCLQLVAAILLATWFYTGAARAEGNFEKSERQEKLPEPWEKPEKPVHQKIDKPAGKDAAQVSQIPEPDMKDKSKKTVKAKKNKKADSDLYQPPAFPKPSSGLVNK